MGINCEDLLCGRLRFAVVLAHFLIRIEIRKPVFTLDEWRRKRKQEYLLLASIRCATIPCQIAYQKQMVISLLSAVALCWCSIAQFSSKCVYSKVWFSLATKNGKTLYSIEPFHLFNSVQYKSVWLHENSASFWKHFPQNVELLYMSACTVCMIFCNALNKCVLKHIFLPVRLRVVSII